MKNSNLKPIKKTSSNKLLKYVVMGFAVATHLAIIALLLLSYKYYDLQLLTFIPIVIIVVCLLAIIDILFYFGIKFKNDVAKYITIGLSVLLLIVGLLGSYYVGRINKTVNTVIENDGTEQYETVYGSFTYYNTSGHKFTDLEDLANESNLTIGYVADGGTGPATVGQEKLNEAGVKYTAVQYTSNNDLLSDLVTSDGEDLDFAIFSSSFLQSLANDDEVDYSAYLENMTTFYTFEEKIKTGDNEAAGKDLYTDPFNILLIGYAPESDTYGLADSIILATVNPKTFTVVLTSIARDSYVEICGTGSREKINAARGTSRQCLMDTVGEILDVDVNYYMEVNFNGVVEIVDAVGGIVVSNPVEFVGQDPSTTRGEYTVLVPAGDEVVCDGKMALAFARERYAYADGDFQRQLNQQQVISRISEKLLALKDVNQALNVMEAAGNNFTTNLSLSQLTGIFNYLINHTNTTGMSTFNMIDIQSMRVTGYASNYYSYSMMLPQWIYRLYNGSITECQERIDDVMNNYSTSDVRQMAYFKFFVEYPYDRGQLYSEYFNEAQVVEEMPAYYPKLTKMSYSEVVAWAASNGVTLNVTFINETDAGYDASLAGSVTYYSVPFGALVSNYPTCSITVMGNQNEDTEYDIVCDSKDTCEAFAKELGVSTSNDTANTTDQSQDGQFAYAKSSSGNSKIKKSETLVLYYYKYSNETVAIPQVSGTYEQYVKVLQSLGFTNIVPGTITEGATETNNGTLTGTVNPSVGSQVTKDTTIIVYVYSYKTKTETWDNGTVIEPTCTEQGYTLYKSSLGNIRTDTYVSALGHVLNGEETVIQDPTECNPGSKTVECTRCHEKIPVEIPATNSDSESCAQIAEQ